MTSLAFLSPVVFFGGFVLVCLPITTVILHGTKKAVAKAPWEGIQQIKSHMGNTHCKLITQRDMNPKKTEEHIHQRWGTIYLVGARLNLC